MRIRSDDIELFYETVGDGPPAVFLHPFPAHHQYWSRVVEQLSTRFRIVLPDLRGHGESGVGDGPATMQKHADDLARLCDVVGIGRGTFVGSSIGGYILLEFWRRHRQRVSALVLTNTKASADAPDARAARLRSARQVVERGPEQFIDSMLEKLLGESTRRNRPDVVAEAKRMMMKNSSQAIAQVQMGMAERPDSVPTLATIDVPTLVIAGEEDALTPLAEMQGIHRDVRNSEIRVVPKAGHYAAFEQPEEVAGLLRDFLGTVKRTL